MITARHICTHTQMIHNFFSSGSTQIRCACSKQASYSMQCMHAGCTERRERRVMDR
uniref:Uncharacterized protein n=1 Tax=Oryza brachyantha TaxID=4533 RepID=J3M7H3_ORYBR